MFELADLRTRGYFGYCHHEIGTKVWTVLWVDPQDDDVLNTSSQWPNAFNSNIYRLLTEAQFTCITAICKSRNCLTLAKFSCIIPIRQQKTQHFESYSVFVRCYSIKYNHFLLGCDNYSLRNHTPWHICFFYWILVFIQIYTLLTGRYKHHILGFTQITLV